MRLLEIARASVEHGMTAQEPLEPDPACCSATLARRLGSFVTLTHGNTLRGCVGSLQPTVPLAQGVAVAAFNAAYRDRRFEPLSREEVDAVHIEISVLSPLEPIDATTREQLLTRLQPGEDGLLLEVDGHRATFLPKVWQSINDPGEFVGHLMRKAGLPGTYWSDSLRFYRYRTASVAESPDASGSID